MKYIFLLTLVVASALAIESNFYAEESCTNVKGYCVLESECHHQVSATEKSLCPGQKKDGAICCKNFPSENVNCHQTHNACMDRCPDSLNLGRKGCPEKMSCCVLI